ncbi:MAG: exodeoxyribonuclease V subunit beta [Gammaproteobacteria bacterium]|nr:exodeoxyribonuclease V subunit beta [Gammaproteobacteria bacterium]
MNPTDKTALNVALGAAPELLIEASAGTGKTYALTTLAARLLVEERVEIGELLVVTFTIAATGELRDRIRATLRGALRRAEDESASSDPQATSLLERWQGLGIDNADVARRLDLALLDLDRANVMTIHGFCQRVLADFAFEGGLPFAFEMAGDGADTLHAAVTDEWRRWAYPASPLLVRYAMKKGFSADELAGWVSGYVARIGLEIVGADSPTEEASSGLDGLEGAWRDTVRKARDTHEAEAASMSDGDRDRVAAVLQRPEVTFCTKNASYLGNKTQRKRLHDGNPVLAEVLDELDRKSGELRIGYDGLLPCLRRDALKNTRDLLEERVREDRKLGFDDLLTGVHRAFDTGKGLARRIRDRYPWALIDEYQDTDRVQAEIFRRIYRDTRLADDHGALITVGDPKQSIYRFRSADIFAYLNTRDAVAVDAKLSLSRNYRSVPALTAAVNAVFDHSCPFALPGIGYDPVESAIKEPDLAIDGETLAGDGSAPLQIRYFPWDPKQLRNKPDMGDLAARLAADEIAATLKLADVERAKLGRRPVRGSDIAVLVRTAAQGRRVARELHARHIASVEIGIENVMASREAEQLERLLWAIAKPQSPHRTRGALTADVLGLDAAAVGALQDDDNAWNVWTERLANWLEEWKRADVATLIRRILESGEVKGAERLLRYRDGARRLTNLKHLAELLQQTETRERYSPTGLAAWFTRQRANAGDRDEMALLRLDSDEQLVKIVTMHAAKGLEFPIVFCPFLWDANMRRDPDWANYHAADADHREVLHLDPSKAELDVDWQEGFSDETRLLYVALTRAQERCVVTWTKIRSTENAPLAWLLYGRKSASEEMDAASVVKIAGAAKELSPEQWRAGLDDLASRCSTDIGIVDMDPGYESPGSVGTVQAAPELTVRRLDRGLARVRQMSSYSALAHSAGVAESPSDHETVEQPDRDEIVTAEEEDEATADGEAVRNAFTFPSGRRVGNCLHRIFERLDRGEEESVEDACRESLARYRINAQWAEVARSLVTNTRATLLAAAEGPGVGKGFRLLQVERAVPEMEFHLPLEGLDRRRLGETLADHGYDDPFAGSRSNIEGYLRGFIDLVAGHDGVWYVLDYKSNWLGNRPDDYAPAGISKAMRDHRYPLQYLLYVVALNRYLASRLPDYDYDQHIGGAFYLFLRGIEPAAGMDRGVYFDRPSRACIDALDACFRGVA